MYPIASVTSPSSGDVAFTNIPQTFTHLQVRVFARSSYTGNPTAFSGLYINGSPTSNNYPTHLLLGDGSSATASSNTTNNQFTPDSYNIPTATNTANVYGAVIWDILDYANTNKYKTVKVISGFDANGSGRVSLGSGVWLSTSAITQLDITTVNNFVAGSVISLYGITTA